MTTTTVVFKDDSLGDRISHMIVFIQEGSQLNFAKMGYNNEWCGVENNNNVNTRQLEQEINFKMQELDRLRSVVPSCQGVDVSQMEVILQAIQYIQDLQRRLGLQELDRLKSVVPSCQGENVSQMEVILQAIQYMQDLQRSLGKGW